MKFQEILEACWSGYQQQGMKKKGNRMVPNCVPVAEVKIGPEITGKDLLFKAAAMAMRDASHEGISLDYEQAIRQASKIYGIPYTPSELPKLLAQRAEIDRQLALLKQGKQVAKQRRKEKLAPTPAGAEEYWKTHALPTDRIKPATKTLEAIEEDLRKWFKEKWVRFGPDGKIRGSCARGSAGEGKPKCLPQAKAHALGKKGRASAAAKKRREDPNAERRGPAKNVATKVKEGVPQQAIHRYLAIDAETDVEAVRAAIKAISQDSTLSDSQKSRYLAYIFALVRKHRLLIGRPYYQFLQRYMEEQVDNEWDDADEFGMPGSEFFPDEDDRLRDGDYVRDSQDGEYGEVFRMVGDPTERRVRILDRDGKGWYISPERLVAVDRDDPDIQKYFGKRRHRDMDESRGGNYEELGLRKSSADRFAVLDRTLDAVIMTTNDLKAAKQEAIEWADYDDIKTEIIDQVTGKKIFAVNGNVGAMKYLDEKQDACYRKVKSRYKVWPSAYASGALVQCRKKGAANWGNKGK